MKKKPILSPLQMDGGEIKYELSTEDRVIALKSFLAETKKELLKELGNVSVNTPPPILPDVTPEKKTAQDIMAEHLTKGGFGN